MTGRGSNLGASFNIAELIAFSFSYCGSEKDVHWYMPQQLAVINEVVKHSYAGRAFRIKWGESTPGNSLSSVLEAPDINWEFAEEDMEGPSTHREDWYLQFGMHPPDARDFIVFGKTDLRRLAPDSRTVAFKLNAGSIDKLFYNPYHREQVTALPLELCYEHFSSSNRTDCTDAPCTLPFPH